MLGNVEKFLNIGLYRERKESTTNIMLSKRQKKKKKHPTQKQTNPKRHEHRAPPSKGVRMLANLLQPPQLILQDDLLSHLGAEGAG